MRYGLIAICAATLLSGPAFADPWREAEILDALRDLPARQRACLVLRYYDELGIDDIAATLGVSRNSVKTHLQRGLAALEARLAADPEDDW